MARAYSLDLPERGVAMVARGEHGAVWRCHLPCAVRRLGHGGGPLGFCLHASRPFATWLTYMWFTHEAMGLRLDWLIGSPMNL
jgi:hypothetical protein